MAILRGREVQIVDVVWEQDPSTFTVKYSDGETEIAKMHELAFTQPEYDQYVKVHQPQVKMVDDVKSEAKTQPTPKAPVKK